MAEQDNLLSNIDFEPWGTDTAVGSMDYLLDILAKVRAERETKIHDLQTDMEVLLTAITQEKQPYNKAERELKGALLYCLGLIEGEKHESELGKAQIVRPKNRISYDQKGLEVLRKSSDEVARLIGHLRKEKKSEPYLKVKLK